MTRTLKVLALVPLWGLSLLFLGLGLSWSMRAGSGYVLFVLAFIGQVVLVIWLRRRNAGSPAVVGEGMDAYNSRGV